MKYTKIFALMLGVLLLAGSVDAQVSVRRTGKKSEATEGTAPRRDTPKGKDQAPASAPAKGKDPAPAKGKDANQKPVAPSDAAKPSKPASPSPARKPAGTATPRKSGSAKPAASVATDGKTLRQQNFDDYQKESQEATPWQHIVYREIDLTKDQNASLYYPVEPQDGLTNAFRVILDAFCKGDLPAYEFLDGRESFDEKYKVKVPEILKKFQINFQEKPKADRSGKVIYEVDETDVPSNECLSYYVKERWEFDQKHSQYKPRVLAICPVLRRSGDFGGSAVAYPMFWLNFEDVRPFLRDHLIVSSGMNTAPRYTMEEFFTLNQYDGTIYKEQNLRGLTLMQQYADKDSLAMAQKELNEKLEAFGDSIWEKEEVVEEEPAKKGHKAKVEKAGKATSQEVSEAKAATETSAATNEKTKKNRRTKETVDVEAAEAERQQKASTHRSVRR